MLKRIAHYALVLTVAGTMTAQAGALNEIRFPSSDWGLAADMTIMAGTAYLPGEMVVAIDAPPANDSEAVRQELEYLRGLKAQRTPEQVELIRQENEEINPVGFFTDLAGLDPEVQRKTVALLQAVNAETVYFIMREKIRFQRARPAQLADDLEQVVPTPPHASYPSGHAAQAQALALVLAKLDPARGEAYKQRARDIAWRRELAGLHYPSDSAAGQQLAAQVVEALEKDEGFAAFFEKARKEFEGFN